MKKQFGNRNHRNKHEAQAVHRAINAYRDQEQKRHVPSDAVYRRLEFEGGIDAQRIFSMIVEIVVFVPIFSFANLGCEISA